MVSKALEGRPVGGFRFYGTRSDDPNYLIAHEHRRELRGYGTFSAWLNHVDSKSSTRSIPSSNRTANRSCVIICWISAPRLGARASIRARRTRLGVSLEGKKALGGIPSLGLYVKNWRTIPLIVRTPLARSIDNTQWDPERWKPRYANSAFRSARMDDKFWAALRLQAFTDDMLNTLIRVGRFNDPTLRGVLSKFLIERRDAIVRRYLPAVNPVTDVAC